MTSSGRKSATNSVVVVAERDVRKRPSASLLVGGEQITKMILLGSQMQPHGTAVARSTGMIRTRRRRGRCGAARLIPLRSKIEGVER